jgi:hypothetical protein
MPEVNYPLRTMIKGSIKPSKATMHGFMVIYWLLSQNQKQKMQCLIMLWNLVAKLP